jgi:hypothetical protein
MFVKPHRRCGVGQMTLICWSIPMATRAAVKTRRRAVRAVTRVAHPSSRPSLAVSLVRLANSRPARAAFVVIGTMGLTAVAVALVGPKRIERDVIKPLRGAIEPQAEKLWAESKPLREQIADLFRATPPSGREKLVKNFQSWIGHFHAT